MDHAELDLTPVAAAAAELVRPGMSIGLGTGHAATAFVHALAKRVNAGLSVRGVPTSESVAVLARELGVPLVTLNEAPHLDFDFDGADEVAPDSTLIKGYGGALVREKIVAAAADRLVILVGAEKLVPQLGTRGKLPVEVVPFALPVCLRRFAELGVPGAVRLVNGVPFTSDNGNAVVDLAVGPLGDPAALDASLRAIPGVVGTGLFLDFRATVYVQTPRGVEVHAAP